MLTTAQISDYANKANTVLEENVLTIIRGAKTGKKTSSLYYSTEWLSAGVDVINSNNGLTNLQLEIIIQKMIQEGNLNDFNGDPIPYIIAF